MDFDSFKPEFYISIYLSAPFLVSCLLHSPLPGLVSHVTHVCVITNDGRHFIITYNGLIQAGNKPFTFSVVFDLNSIQPVDGKLIIDLID